VPDCRVNAAYQVELAFQKSGTVESLMPQGRSVRRGEVVAQQSDAIVKAAFKIAERESANDIEIRFAKKAGELAQLKYERAQQADKRLSGTVTDFELRELRLAAEQSLLQLQQAEHQFAIAELKKDEQQVQLQALQIRSPFDGFVRAAPKQSGEYVREGETVIEIVNDSVMKVEGSIDAAQLEGVSIGRPVIIRSLHLGKEISFRGSVDFVDSKIEPISMKVKISALVQNENSILKDGLLVSMAIAPVASPQLSKK
jgi:RND family efflux transporter MFP subunit